MENDQDPPFPREPWQRLLQERAGAPSETPDARIRAAARRAVLPRAARWWLPASLAASFLLAVILVQLQFGKDDEPAVVTEADLAEPAAPQAPAAAANEAARPQQKESATRPAPFERPPAEFAPEPEARLGGPEQDLKSASEWVEDKADDDLPLLEDDRALQEAPATAITAQPRALSKARAPDDWYAEIEAMRKAGRTQEADAELARFEAAYPDWLEQQGLRKP
jgi:hypothetical protein